MIKKKKAAVISFTPQGKRLAEKIIDLEAVSFEICPIHRPKPFSDWLKEHFQALDALIFIGAVGIIVREMAPLLESKQTDPAVVVLDEKGRYVISVLSGHLGGANALTKELSAKLGAAAVITTSSDVNEKIAIDVFAKKNDLVISSMEQAKRCAAAIVSNAFVSFFCEGAVHGAVPPELSADLEHSQFQVIVSPYLPKKADTRLHLIPKAIVLGIGCKKGIKKEVIEARVMEELGALSIDPRSILGIATIDLKREEEGLLAFSKVHQLPMFFYSARELSDAEGAFSSSAFVKQITGVENVCERAAVCLAGDRKKVILLPKTGKDGVTVSIVEIDWSVRFE